MQSLIDESVHALFAAVVEQIHKFAQVSAFIAASPRSPESSQSYTFLLPTGIFSGFFKHLTSQLI